MNCKRVDQLLPLYVGRDLEAELSRSVLDHLQSCRACTRVADEYVGANRLLQGYESPFFSDEVYTGIRNRVVDEIERRSLAPAWPGVVQQFLGQLAQPRLKWITTALLLVTLFSALYFITKRSNELPSHPQIAAGARTVNPNAAAGREENRPSPNAMSSALSPTRKKVVEGRRSLRTRQNVVLAATKTRVSPDQRLVQSNISGSLPLLSRPSVRVEMQTRDPNIRIIWLPTQRVEPGVRETSKGS